MTVSGEYETLIPIDEYLAAGYPDDSELAAIFAHYNTAGLHTALAGPAGLQERRAPEGAQPAQVIRVEAPTDRTAQLAGTAPDFLAPLDIWPD